MRKILICLLFLVLFQTGFAQMSLYSSGSDTLMEGIKQEYIPAPALVDKFNPRKPLWIPIVESVGLNLSLGAFNTYANLGVADTNGEVLASVFSHRAPGGQADRELLRRVLQSRSFAIGKAPAI